MRFLITPNNLRADALQYARTLAQTLRSGGHTPYVLPETAACPGWQAAPVWDGCAPLDMLLIVGGVGTLLKNIRDVGRYDIPVWGVNFGHLGYLTECEPAEADAAIGRILRGEYTTEERVLLQGQVFSGGQPGARFLAVNEANICRGAMARALRLELSVSGSFVRSLSADGLIISTPTGSTAYNFSAGGPILLPTMDCFAITPVCPHAALGCAIVASGRDYISVRVHIPQEEEGAPPLLVADGCEKFTLRDGDEIRMRRADVTLKTVKTREQNFYAKLQRKLAEG